MAEKCHAYAKALHYRELIFAQETDGMNKERGTGKVSMDTLAAIISLDNQLQQPIAAAGILEVSM